MYRLEIKSILKHLHI